MPVKGENLESITAISSLDHHGVDVLIDVAVVPIRAIIHRGIEMIDPDSGMSSYTDAVELLRSDLPTHTHGTSLTIVATSEVLKLQKTIKDDGQIKMIEVTR